VAQYRNATHDTRFYWFSCTKRYFDPELQEYVLEIPKGTKLRSVRATVVTDKKLKLVEKGSKKSRKTDGVFTMDESACSAQRAECIKIWLK